MAQIESTEAPDVARNIATFPTSCEEVPVSHRGVTTPDWRNSDDFDRQRDAPLIGSDDEVSGFGVEWPGLRSLGVWKAPAGTEALAGKTKPDARGFGTWGTTGTT